MEGKKFICETDCVIDADPCELKVHPEKNGVPEAKDAGSPVLCPFGCRDSITWKQV